MIDSKHLLDMNFSWEWKRVFRNNDEEYAFPEDITKFMNKEYNFPTVYRWCICKDSQIQLYYIGESVKLCARLRNYLNPDSTQQTNKRLNEIFSQLEQGSVAKIDYISFEKVNLGEFVIMPSDLKDKHIRKALEGILICYYNKIYPKTMINR